MHTAYFVNSGCGHQRVVYVEGLQGVVMATNHLQTSPPDLVSERILHTNREPTEKDQEQIVYS